ncbi:hypothetical protein GCM10017673_11270 [Streptosporangium violaceochromogenes]|nr:hypothetical protein GCM10017673_11270 [Streptosporangium violaceochromogenes]
MASFSHHPLADGVVTVWHDVDGWGVISSPDVPGEVWVHFSRIVTDSHPELTVGEVVRFSWEEFPQDDFRFRAVQVFREPRTAK